MKHLFTTLVFIVLSLNGLYAQEQQELPAPKPQKLKFYLDANKQNSVTFGAGVQVWGRHASLNPGSLDKNTGLSAETYTDFAIRRARLSMLANFGGKYFFYTQYGNTSLAPYNGRTARTFFHDIWAKVKITKGNELYLGAGQHMFNGLSRLSNTSYGSILVIDNPGFSFPNVNVNDMFVRQIGVFAHGKINRLSYQFAVNKPIMDASRTLSTQQIIDKGAMGVAQNRKFSNMAYRGYADWSFATNEKVGVTPFKSTSYFGEKGTFLNIGAGFQLTPNASGILMEENQVQVHDQLAVAVDLFFETPTANGGAVSAYAALFQYDYGDNYLWQTIPMGGIASTDPNADFVAQQGPGINQYTFGSGQVGYAMIGYLLPFKIHQTQRIMPFGAVQYKDLEALNEASLQYDLGAHYLIHKNAVKLSVQYSTRPIYNEGLTVEDHKGMMIAQLQFKI
ncbi:hypothetical protein [Algivirga pacifica]|uniref:Short chain amide porin n=1 Tax=Algivirga pacifica TaxID=1162670 RepID=A0ABP9D419_9BACT